MAVIEAIPNVRVKKDTLKEFSETMRWELDLHKRGTAELRHRMMTWLDLYEGRAPIKNKPYKNASNLIIPFATINVDAIKAQLKQSIKQATQQWIGEAVEIVDTKEKAEEKEEGGVDWNATATAFERMANWVTNNSPHFNWDEFLDDWTDELAKMGTAVIKTHYEIDSIPTKRWNPLTEEEEKIDKVKMDAPVAEIIPLDRCVWPLSFTNLRRMWYFGHTFKLTKNQMKVRVTSHRYNKAAVNRVIKSGGDTNQTDADKHKDEKEGIEARLSEGSVQQFHMVELWVSYDIDEDGFEEELLCHFHPATGEVVRLIYQPFLRLPFDRSVFEPRGKRFLGRGAIEPLEHMIRGASIVANQTIDAQHIANANCVTTPADSEAEIVMEDGVEPGLVIPVASKEEQEMIREFSIGNPGAVVSFQLLEVFRAFIERLGHVADPQLGRIESGKRTPAATVLSLLQEGTRLIDEVIARMRPVAGRIMLRLIELYNQRDPQIFQRVLGNQDGDLIIKAFADQREVSDFIKISLNAQSAAHSKQIEQQNLMAFSQFVTGYARQLMELATPFVQPGMPDEWRRIAIEIVKAIEKTLMKLAITFQQDEPMKQIPQVAALFEEVANSLQAAATAGGGGLANPAVAGPPAGPGPAIPPEGALPAL